MAVLVTGGCGYIGSATVEHLLARGEQVVVIDNLSRGRRAAVPATVPFVQGDVGDALSSNESCAIRSLYDHTLGMTMACGAPEWVRRNRPLRARPFLMPLEIRDIR